MAIDHDHSCCPGEITCGECIRGILCRRCNSGLGLFRDDWRIAQNAMKYLAGIRNPALTDPRITIG